MDLLRDDRILNDAFRRGDEKALLRVYHAYAEEVFVFLRRGFSFCAREKHYVFAGYKKAWQLESAVQDVFLRAFRDTARLAYDGQRPFKGYLFTIARNLVMDKFRKAPPGRLDARPFQEIDDSEMLRERPPSPEQLVGETELREAVQRFFDGLETQARSFFQLRFVEGVSLEEASKRLEVSDYRVKQFEKRIKKQFFFYMREQGYFRGYGYRDPGVEKIVTTVLVACSRGVGG